MFWVFDVCVLSVLLAFQVFGVCVSSCSCMCFELCDWVLSFRVCDFSLCVCVLSFCVRVSSLLCLCFELFVFVFWAYSVCVLSFLHMRVEFCVCRLFVCLLILVCGSYFCVFNVCLLFAFVFVFLRLDLFAFVFYSVD